MMKFFNQNEKEGGEQKHGGVASPFEFMASIVNRKPLAETQVSNTTAKDKASGGDEKPSLINFWIYLSTRVWFWRSLFLLFLICVAVVIGAYVGSLLKDSENRLIAEQFDSISERASDAAIADISRKAYAALLMSTIVACAFPDAETWPNVGFPNFKEFAALSLTASTSEAMAIVPIVQPSEVADFENFMYDYYEREFPGKNVGLAYGRGIHSFNYSKTPMEPYHDTTGDTIWGSPNKILTPFSQIISHEKSIHDYGSINMLNFHASEHHGKMIDGAIECTEEHAKNLSHECGFLSEFVPGLGEARTSLVYPIYPKNNLTTVTGFISTTIIWEDVLRPIFAGSANGIDCVITWSDSDLDHNHDHDHDMHDLSNAYSFTIRDGEPVAKGWGHQHEHKYSHTIRTVDLTVDSSFSPHSPRYFLELYETGEFVETYRTSDALVASISILSMMVLTAVFFILYDYFVHSGYIQRNTVINTKHKFVRYISHQLRTPLNVISMGLKILADDMTFRCSSYDKNVNASTDSLATMTLYEAPPTVVRQLSLAEEECAHLSPKAQNSPGTIRECPSDAELIKMRKRSLSQTPTASSRMTGSFATSRRAEVARESTKAKGAEWLELVEDMLLNSQSAVDVIDDLLNFDEIENGQLDLKLTIVSIWTLIEDSVIESRLAAMRAGASVRLSMEEIVDSCNGCALKSDNALLSRPDNIECLQDNILRKVAVGDVLRLSQMLRNLLINALNFTPEGGEVVMSCNIVDVPKTCSKSLHRREVSDTNAETVYKCNLSNFLEIKVCRSGVPLSNDRILRVKNGTNNFDIEQLQASEETGLALHVAKGIVERHGGSLTCVTPAQACGVVSYVVLLPLYELEGYNTSYLLDMSRHSDIMRGTPTEVGDSFDEVNESETIRKAQLQNRAKRVIESADVVLLLKGTPQEPLCSSSKQMVDLLTLHGVPYSYFNILSDEGIRQAVKIYSGWLAYPQLYVKGSLVGSLDNVKRLIEEKRLQDVIQNGYEGSRKAMVLRTSSLSSLASLRDMNGKNLADLTPRTIRHNVSFLNAEPGESEESSANVKKFESTSEPRPLMLDDPAAAAATDVHSLLLADSAAAAATDTHDGKAKDANKLLSTVNSPSTTAEGSETSLRMLVTGAPSAPITPIVLSPPPPVREQANSDVIFEKKRLLVVDDVLSNRKMLIRLLSKYKHTCEEAKHGAEAVEKWEDAILLGDPYDAILMDSEMPIMTGPQASRILREKGCVIPIIGITGNVLDVDVQNFKAHGADAVLPKPLNMKELIKVWKQLTSCGHAKLSTSAGNASSGVPCGEIHQPTNPVSHSLFSIKIPSHGPAKVHVAYEAMAFESQTHRMGESRNHLPHDQAMRGSDASDVQCNAVTERRDKYVAIPEAQ